MKLRAGRTVYTLCCGFCETQFDSNRLLAKFCSHHCYLMDKSRTYAGAITKKCARCKEIFPIDQFRSKRTLTAVRISYCAQCEKDRLVEYRTRTESKPRYRVTRKKRLRTKTLAAYGLTLQDYDDMDSKQLGLCAICKKPCESRDKLSVDHDHETGEVRGLLCMTCNVGLGNFKDNIDLLLSAVAYLGGKEAIDKIIDDNIVRYSEDRLEY